MPFDISDIMILQTRMIILQVHADAREGSKYKRTYMKDVQFVFSRVQHHTHAKTKKGYVPLGACTRKGTKKPKCRFPKNRQLNSKARVICRGNARRYDLRITGKRNSLGRPKSVQVEPKTRPRGSKLSPRQPERLQVDPRDAQETPS